MVPKITHSGVSICFTVLLVLAACNGADETSSGEPAAVESNQAIDPDVAAAITSEYLAGAWCYSHFEADDRAQQQNINYVFENDGTLLYQVSPLDAVDQPGTWSFREGRLRINPYFMLFNLRVNSREQDQLVLDGMGRHYFRRGTCSQQG